MVLENLSAELYEIVTENNYCKCAMTIAAIDIELTTEQDFSWKIAFCLPMIATSFK